MGHIWELGWMLVGLIYNLMGVIMTCVTQTLVNDPQNYLKERFDTIFATHSSLALPMRVRSF